MIVEGDAPDVHDDPSWSDESARRFGCESLEAWREQQLAVEESASDDNAPKDWTGDPQ